MSYVRVSITGVMFGGEVWSVNPTFDPTGEFPGGVSQPALDAACQAIADRTIPGVPKTFLSSSASRTGARVEVRDDATDALIGISVKSSATPSTGTAVARMPAQSAIVVSLRTDVPGGSGRGRMYWPLLDTVLDASNRVATAQLTTFLADMKGYLTGIQSDLGAAFPTIGFNLAVRSRTTHTTPHVVRLQVGNVVDTQRRRRDALVEGYVTTAY